MRLTIKSEKDSLGYEPIDWLVKSQNASPLIAKLGQLEDIEDELGIDLVTLFKALKNGVYVKGLGYFRYADFDFEGKVIIYGDIDPICGDEFLSDYGKTWALTKEELECNIIKL